MEEYTPTEKSRLARSQETSGTALLRQYCFTQNMDDLEGAVGKFQDAVNLTIVGDPYRAKYKHKLAQALRVRYQMLKDLNDLQAALQTGQEALDITADGHPDRLVYLSTLAASFRDRFHRLGDLNDLEVAAGETTLQLAQEAVALTPQGHLLRARKLCSLAESLEHRYYGSRDLNDLETVLQMRQEVIDLTPDGDYLMPHNLCALARSLMDRYERQKNLNDLEAAMQNLQKAVTLTPIEKDRASILELIARNLMSRYHRLGDLKDLEVALKMRQDALNLVPDGHCDRLHHLQQLAVSFGDQYRRFGRLDDLTAMNTHYAASFETPGSYPHASWNAALKWAAVAAEFKSSSCITAYFHAFRLLPEILWIGNDLHVRHETMRRLDIGQAISAAAKACIEFSNLMSAVEIMEQGLAFTFQQMLQLRTNFDALPQDEAQKLRIVSLKLYSGISHDQRDLALQREKILEEVRQQPGLHYFLRPKPYKVLSQASQGGPIVILISYQNHCDGIIIKNPTSNPVHVSLPDVTPDMLKLQQKTLRELLGYCNIRTRGESTSTRLFGRREQFGSKTTKESFEDLLTWLHMNVVAPVYQVLESHGIQKGRLWWLPTGAFTALPLHAAAPTNQFIHSYTATLGTLLDAYAKKLSSPPEICVVGVTHTGDGSNYLPAVKQEVKKILSIIKEPQVSCLQGDQATVNAVKRQLEICSWVHLACHGKQDLLEPIKSHLLLHGGILDLESILRMPLSNAEFVFLAACQTAMGDAGLMNESFHLGGGFIAAGFKSAIGTMWSMSDQDGPAVAELVYSHLFREGRQPQARDTAEGLQIAIDALKAQKVSYERWIPFIHMGV
ncbi:CHAT domain-containing protein [Mycena capillaripes]|nr:CHAT domain-containing protein [Mycena capillaripes]